MLRAVTLDTMLDAAATGAVEVEAGWGQGRATYGGLVAALLVSRAQAVTEDPARRLRAMAVTFAGPVAPGGATVDAEVLRQGSSATTVAARLMQGDAVHAQLTASFGAARETAVRLTPDAPVPAQPAAAEIEPLPFVEGLMPDFLQHVELRFGGGAPPFSGAAEGAFHGWMRFREPTSAFGERELVALVDAWPPGVSPLFNGPAPMSTLSWTLELLEPPTPSAPDLPGAHWQYDVRTVAASGGWGQTEARVWDEAGQLRALSHQTVAYFG